MSSAGTHSGHRSRLRHRFLETGVSGFSEHELLELLLFYALPRVNTNEIAHDLINRFGSLTAVLEAPPDKIAEAKGVSSASAFFLKLIYDMCRKYASSGAVSACFSSSDDIDRLLINYFSSVESEICLLLNISMKLELLGTVSFTAESLLSGRTSPRDIAEIALRNNAHRIIIGLNHPDKPPVPDENDYKITNMLANTLLPLGVDIIDCIVCGFNRTFSMRRSGAFSFSTGAPENL